MANHSYAILKGNITPAKLNETLNEVIAALGEGIKISNYDDNAWGISCPHMDQDEVWVYWNSARKIEWRHPVSFFDSWLLDYIMSKVSQQLNATHWLDDGLGDDEKMGTDFADKYPHFVDYRHALYPNTKMGKFFKWLDANDPRDNLF